jgi:hypothetical protein
LVFCEVACCFRTSDVDIFLIDVLGGFQGGLLLREEEILNEGAALIVTEQVLRVFILQLLFDV